MDEAHLRLLAEQLLVTASMIMEDTSAAMIVGGRQTVQLATDADQLCRASDDLAALASCAAVLVRRAHETARRGPAPTCE